MAESYSWLAMREIEAGQISRMLSMQHSGHSGALGSAAFQKTKLPAGWELVVAKRFDFADQAPLEELSHEGELLTCCVHEPLMYSSVSQWSGGQRQWYIVHDGQQGIQHLLTEGNPPQAFHRIANRLMVNQAEAGGLNITVDQVFDIAGDLGHALTGFRHDEVTAAELQFDELHRI